MSDRPESVTPSVAQLQARLYEISQLLRETRTIEERARRDLAEMVDELGKVLESAPAPPTEVAHLIESTAHLAEALHHQHDRGLLSRARDRLEEAVVRAEVSHPFAAGLAKRLLETLANIGI